MNADARKQREIERLNEVRTLIAENESVVEKTGESLAHFMMRQIDERDTAIESLSKPLTDYELRHVSDFCAFKRGAFDSDIQKVFAAVIKVKRECGLL